MDLEYSPQLAPNTLREHPSYQCPVNGRFHHWLPGGLVLPKGLSETTDGETFTTADPEAHIVLVCNCGALVTRRVPEPTEGVVR